MSRVSCKLVNMRNERTGKGLKSYDSMLGNFHHSSCPHYIDSHQSISNLTFHISGMLSLTLSHLIMHL